MAILNRVSAGIMRQFVSWDTACNFNDVIQKFKNLKCLITDTSTLVTKQFFTSVKDIVCKHFFMLLYQKKEVVTSSRYTVLM